MNMLSKVDQLQQLAAELYSIDDEQEAYYIRENKELKQIITDQQAELAEYKKPLKTININPSLQEISGVAGLKAEIKKDGCCVCGYTACDAALEFHHYKTKNKSLSNIHMIDVFIQEIEAHPVVLLCACCHREVHAGLLEIDFERNRVQLTGGECVI